ncbi:hypothetical protein HQ571_03140 [Candidatus Kuenenbacteria bacterium]|nr:hypothetical protein [Candidatus Kuenenbacteria bacterium]
MPERKKFDLKKIFENFGFVLTMLVLIFVAIIMTVFAVAYHIEVTLKDTDAQSIEQVQSTTDSVTTQDVIAADE